MAKAPPFGKSKGKSKGFGNRAPPFMRPQVSDADADDNVAAAPKGMPSPKNMKKGGRK